MTIVSGTGEIDLAETVFRVEYHLLIDRADDIGRRPLHSVEEVGHPADMMVVTERVMEKLASRHGSENVVIVDAHDVGATATE